MEHTLTTHGTQNATQELLGRVVRLYEMFRANEWIVTIIDNDHTYTELLARVSRETEQTLLPPDQPGAESPAYNHYLDLVLRENNPLYGAYFICAIAAINPSHLMAWLQVMREAASGGSSTQTRAYALSSLVLAHLILANHTDCSATPEYDDVITTSLALLLEAPRGAELSSEPTIGALDKRYVATLRKELKYWVYGRVMDTVPSRLIFDDAVRLRTNRVNKLCGMLAPSDIDVCESDPQDQDADTRLRDFVVRKVIGIWVALQSTRKLVRMVCEEFE